MRVHEIKQISKLFEIDFTKEDLTFDGHCYVSWNKEKDGSNNWAISGICDNRGESIKLTTDEQSFLISQCEGK